MPKKEAPIHTLEKYLPAGTYPDVLQYLQQYQVHLTISKERSTILGDYRHRGAGHNHRISVNGGLNPYAFLITLIHELAHLLTYEKYGSRVQSHGPEWKHTYGGLLHRFLQNHTFPADIEQEIARMLHNPAASSCAEEGLSRVLHRYDAKKDGWQMVEEMPVNTLFKTTDGRVFKKGEKVRKRFRCVEVSSDRIYLFSPIYRAEVCLTSKF